jgi:hypothetical protein
LAHGDYCPIAKGIQTNTAVPQYTYEEWHDKGLSKKARDKLKSATTRTQPILRKKVVQRTRPPPFREPSYSLAAILNANPTDSGDATAQTEKAKAKAHERMKKGQQDEIMRLQEAYKEQ